MKKQLPYCRTCDVIKGYSESLIAKGENNDCVVRAFASSFDISYDKSHKLVKEIFGRENRKGAFGVIPKMYGLVRSRRQINKRIVRPVGVTKKDSFADYKTLEYTVKVKGVKTIRQMTVGTFVKKYPTGTYFITVDAHAFTIKDGSIIGNYEDSLKCKKIVRYAWKIK